MENTNDSIAQRMKYFRKLRNMTQEDLSNASGINYVLIRKYETGTRNPKFDQLTTIANALGVSVIEFLDIDIDTVGDLMSVITKIDDNTSMEFNGQKDNDGNYIPETISLSFKDDSVNRALSTYMKYRDSIKDTDDNFEVTDSDGNQVTIEQIKGNLITNTRKIKKPEE